MRRISWLNLAAIAVIVTGIVIAFAGHDTLRWAPPPKPPAWAAADRTPADHAAIHVPQHATGPRPSRSTPVRLDIPAIHVHATIISLGLNRNGTLTVPPLSRPGVTSWYDKGPVPGQPGAAAILGHVDATYSVALYNKTRFPTARVFGYTNWPTLRLITCGGTFDLHTRHYLGNVVAFASYVGSFR